jgi:ABC-type dipeptide/oligopeptide/nickel transport system permease component
MLIPVLILAYSQGAPLLRLTRAQMMEVLREDYVRTARAKGMSEQAVVYRHALRNSVIPIFTMLAWDLGRLVNGAVLIEVIFVIPGLGSLFVQAIANRDFALIQGLVLINVLVMLGINLVVDMVYGYLDPRIRYT